jgi:hypothetical protein
LEEQLQDSETHWVERNRDLVPCGEEEEEEDHSMRSDGRWEETDNSWEEVDKVRGERGRDWEGQWQLQYIVDEEEKEKEHCGVEEASPPESFV